MATLDRTLHENVGSVNLHILKYSDIDDTDTQGATYNNIVGYNANATDTPTSSLNASIDVANSSGTFTFNSGEDSRTGSLRILSDG